MSDENNSPQTNTNIKRTGEKVGWTVGWLGGFIWLLALSVLWFFLGKTTEGILAIVLFFLGAGMIIYFSPWRHPSTQYWKLMLPIYLIFFVSIGLVIWSFGSPEKYGLKWWSYTWVLPCFVPLMTVGYRRWIMSNETEEKRSEN